MYEFTLFNKINHGPITSILSISVLTLSICATSIEMAHAEQYCKSIDNSGAVSYTLAPETGCNKKKFKTVSVSHHVTPTNTPTANNVTPKTEVTSTAPDTPVSRSETTPPVSETTKETAKPEGSQTPR